MATKTQTTATIKTLKHGALTVETVWDGVHLCVHRPVLANGAQVKRQWAITHKASGLLAGLLSCSRETARKLAQLWDQRFGDLAQAADARQWAFRRGWIDDCDRAQSRPPHNRLVGPVLPDCPTSWDIAAAVSLAMGGSLAPSDADDRAEQFPAAETVPADRLRTVAGEVEMLWRGRWWTVPTLGEVEEWALDSVAETPDGRTVEPDAPDSWPHLLGVI